VNENEIQLKIHICLRSIENIFFTPLLSSKKKSPLCTGADMPYSFVLPGICALKIHHIIKVSNFIISKKPFIDTDTPTPLCLCCISAPGNQPKKKAAAKKK